MTSYLGFFLFDFNLSYDYFSKQKEALKWRNAVRHNLSSHKYFLKTSEKNAKGHYWSIHPAYLEMLNEALCNGKLLKTLRIGQKHVRKSKSASSSKPKSKKEQQRNSNLNCTVSINDSAYLSDQSYTDLGGGAVQSMDTNSRQSNFYSSYLSQYNFLNTAYNNNNNNSNNYCE